MSRNLQSVIHPFLRWMSKIDEMKYALAEAISLPFPKDSWCVITDPSIHPSIRPSIHPSHPSTAHDRMISAQGEWLLNQVSEAGHESHGYSGQLPNLAQMWESKQLRSRSEINHICVVWTKALFPDEAVVSFVSSRCRFSELLYRQGGNLASFPKRKGILWVFLKLV